MGNWPVRVIPYPLDIDWWGAVDRGEARRQLGIPTDRRIVLFGAVGGEKDPRKGADLLRRALVGLRGVPDGQAADFELVTFGGTPGTDSLDGIPVRSVGKLDDAGLRLYYSAANVMIVPSRQDNLPQTAVEAIACGTPVVAFRVGGLPDIVEDGVTGRLVQPFSPTALADGIAWTLDSARNGALSESARSQAARFDRAIIGASYAMLATRVAASQKSAESTLRWLPRQG